MFVFLFIWTINNSKIYYRKKPVELTDSYPSTGEKWSENGEYPIYDDYYPSQGNGEDLKNGGNSAAPIAAWGLKLSAVDNAKTTESPEAENYPHTTYVNPRYSLPYSKESRIGTLRIYCRFSVIFK